MTECSVDDCTKKPHARNLCNAHYIRWRKFGSTAPTARSHDRSIEDRFWALVNRSESDGCWLWQGGTTRHGYGLFRTTEAGRTITHGAHRLSYELTHGEIPPGMEIDHMCHQPGCVNPAHLRVVTRKQNKENRKGAHGRSGIRGVRFRCGQWEAFVVHNREYIPVGRFATAEEAAEAVRVKRLELFTHSDMDRRAG